MWIISYNAQTLVLVLNQNYTRRLKEEPLTELGIDGVLNVEHSDERSYAHAQCPEEHHHEGDLEYSLIYLFFLEFTRSFWYSYFRKPHSSTSSLNL